MMVAAWSGAFPTPEEPKQSPEAAATLFDDKGVTRVKEICSASPELGPKRKTLWIDLFDL